MASERRIDMAENDAPVSGIERIAAELAEVLVSKRVDSTQARLYELLIEFAEEIKRRSIEP